jgi:TonB family protein
VSGKEGALVNFDEVRTMKTGSRLLLACIALALLASGIIYDVHASPLSESANVQTAKTTVRRRSRRRRARRPVPVVTTAPKETPTPDADGPPPAPPPPPTPEPKPKTVVSGGVLNGKAISKPQPAYPPIAKAARASGTVTVQILVDESGRVVSASAVSGHPLLQQAAVSAARQARFSPTTLKGQPVKVSGIITYNFVLQD